jgi:hypothetical protein
MDIISTRMQQADGYGTMDATCVHVYQYKAAHGLGR